VYGIVTIAYFRVILSCVSFLIAYFRTGSNLIFTSVHAANNNRHMGYRYVGGIVIGLYISGNTAGKEGLLVTEELEKNT
jgi:hypothetical protein